MTVLHRGPMLSGCSLRPAPQLASGRCGVQGGHRGTCPQCTGGSGLPRPALLQRPARRPCTGARGEQALLRSCASLCPSAGPLREAPPQAMQAAPLPAARAHSPPFVVAWPPPRPPARPRPPALLQPELSATLLFTGLGLHQVLYSAGAEPARLPSPSRRRGLHRGTRAPRGRRCSTGRKASWEPGARAVQSIVGAWPGIAGSAKHCGSVAGDPRQCKALWERGQGLPGSAKHCGSVAEDCRQCEALWECVHYGGSGRLPGPGEAGSRGGSPGLGPRAAELGYRSPPGAAPLAACSMRPGLGWRWPR
ncbi:uncharacterized protein LOC112551445 [Alligator sinensis]|uniref:Uncharacterized protein LOC112551445 n=1 Tax=Alligator sinensis TaxID=38654 RepID=A0A3Q0HCS1_ALLSI|nr:uncharacterized protein LOC112551445 [Alligator sinensis]